VKIFNNYRYSKESAMECKTVLVSNKNNDGKIQICTDINNGELIDQTKNINLKYIKVRLQIINNYNFNFMDVVITILIVY